MNPSVYKTIITFLTFAEKLKTTLRSNRTSSPDRRESVAEHTWMSIMLYLIIKPYLEKDYNDLKVIKMIAIHDIPESIIGDTPSNAKEKNLAKHQSDEAEAMGQILTAVESNSFATEMKELWEEFEVKQTPEAQIAQAIDKIEATIQYQIGRLHPFEDYDFHFFPYYKDHLFNSDAGMRKFKDLLNSEDMLIIEEAGLLDRVKPEIRQRWEKEKSQLV